VVPVIENILGLVRAKDSESNRPVPDTPAGPPFSLGEACDVHRGLVLDCAHDVRVIITNFHRRGCHQKVIGSRNISFSACLVLDIEWLHGRPGISIPHEPPALPLLEMDTVLIHLIFAGRTVDGICRPGYRKKEIPNRRGMENCFGIP